VVDTNAHQVIHIDFPPTYITSPNGALELSAPSTKPPPLSADALSASNRERISPPRTPFDYLPDLMAKTQENFKLRTDVKPLHVVQPEGVSFTMNGHELEWQNWKMHIGRDDDISSVDKGILNIHIMASFSSSGGHCTFDNHL
jgi:primary-amine oxidase